ncbi:MAG: peptidoglycan DD-metalloendopeptidase family protein [Proteobacteria bacterium]|nr:peptidoglycan DD-metalloendopeptidase family protein [Pseudomonadota bacterium]
MFIRLLQYVGFGLIFFAFSGCSDAPDGQTSPSVITMPVQAQAGETVEVQPGDTVYSVARRYKVPMSDVISLNQLKAPFVLQAGSSLVLPAKDIMMAPSVAEKKAAETKIAEGQAVAKRKVPLEKIPGVELYKQVAVPDENTPGAPENVVDERAAAAQAQNDVVIYAPAQQKAMTSITADINRKPVLLGSFQKGPSPITQQLNLKPMPYDPRRARLASASPPPPPPPSAPAAGPGLKPPMFQGRNAPPVSPDKMVMPGRFIWPVHGRMVSGFGLKPGGLRNDGVNIAVPMGTPVASADGGTVAYAGNEIPGFGNVVMVRHAGGWITAYGHLERVLVARDTIVAKGDVLGTAGTSGGLNSPQLHFEIRKGAEALDPMRYLSAQM